MAFLMLINVITLILISEGEVMLACRSLVFNKILCDCELSHEEFFCGDTNINDT